MTRPDDLAALAHLSARIGADPLLIQGAGGNTSVKEGEVMWIKASGTLLAEAETRDIFVPCDLPAMRRAITSGDARADQPAEFALAGSLRPSIETCLHAVFAQRVVLHVHCVNTLALAIRRDSAVALAPRLAGVTWAQVPYAKPGAMLAAEVLRVLTPQTDVLILGNHGLIVAAETVAEAEALLRRTVAALTIAPRMALAQPALADRAADGFIALPEDHPLHGVAQHVPSLAVALKGSLYPDHVIFLGPGMVALLPEERPADAVARRLAEGLPPPPVLLVPGAGALIRADASAGAQALARCLGDVLARLADGATVQHLTRAEEAELMNWDAEKYRQSLNAQASHAG